MGVAILRFVCWEAALFAASIRLARLLRWRTPEWWLGVLAIEVTLESSFAALFSFTGWNSRWAYWIVAVVCALAGITRGKTWLRTPRFPIPPPVFAALFTPLVLLSFKPVE